MIQGLQTVIVGNYM